MNNNPWKREPLPKPPMPEIDHWIARLQEIDLERNLLLRKIEIAMIESSEKEVVTTYIPTTREKKKIIIKWKD